MTFQIEHVQTIGSSYMELSKKREDGILYVRVSFRDLKLSVEQVGFKGKRKRSITWASERLHNNYSYRIAKGQKRIDIEFNTYLEYTTQEELNEALQVAWKALRPEPLVINPLSQEDGF